MPAAARRAHDPTRDPTVEAALRAEFTMKVDQTFIDFAPATTPWCRRISRPYPRATWAQLYAILTRKGDAIIRALDLPIARHRTGSTAMGAQGPCRRPAPFMGAR
jgi:hypothetical protein